MFIEMDLAAALLLVVAGVAGAVINQRNEKPIWVGILVGLAVTLLAVSIVGGLIGGVLGIGLSLVGLHMWAS